MQPMLKAIVFVLVIGVLIFISCKKEHSCENCRYTNKPPIAIAGSDQVITLPTDSVSLNGSSSSDPDGKISEWLWKKISGPASFNIIKATDSVTKVKALVVGTYQFELKVTDNGGLSAKDTVQVIVNSTTNHPPIANAGPDQIIVLPINTVILNGSASTDPDNNITGYLWIKISGPSSFSIANTSAVQTQITNLVQSVYQFELKVTDAGGLFSKDTTQVIVNLSTPPPAISCIPATRPLINAQLVPLGTLSETRWGVAVASAGNKILYAGGFSAGSGTATSRVDIYDNVSNVWSTAELSQARFSITVATLGNKIFFSGGKMGFNTPTSRVDVYDVVSNVWSIAELSQSRYGMAAGVVNNKVLFAGGCYDENGPGSNFLFTKRVDIFDASGNSWSTATLSEARSDLTASVIGNNLYFAGGTVLLNVNDYSPTSAIDIYDASNNSWSTSSLSAAKGAHAGIAVNNKIYWAGGRGDGCANYEGCCMVEIRDVNTQTSSFANLFQPNAYFEAVLKDNKIIFFTGAGDSINKFDIYDITTNTWSIGVLSQNIAGASIISVNNIIYIAGGSVNGAQSKQVWKLEF